MIDLISAWLLGMFTNALLNDNSAIVECRMDLLDLEKAIENLEKVQGFPARNQMLEDKEIINELRGIIRKLNVHHAALFFKFSQLQELIDDSLNRLVLYTQEPNEPQNEPFMVGVDLIGIWKEKIPIIRKVLYKGLFCRALHWVCGYKKI